MRDLTGRVAVVTGGASGIGRALALRFLSSGLRVVIADVEGDVAALARTHPDFAPYAGNVLGVPTDVSDDRQMFALAATTVAEFGAVHVICLNAGVAAGGVSWELDRRSWQWVLDVNVWGVVNGIAAFVPTLVEQDEGHVLITSSIGGLIGSPGMAAYSASKHAVVGIAESLRADLELAGSAVGVTVLCPGFTRTRMNESARNWPRQLGEAPELAPGHPAQRREFLARMDDAASPDVVADAAMAAVERDEFWAITDPSVGRRLADHLAPVLGSAGHESVTNSRDR